MEKIEKLTPRDRRIVKHLKAIAEAGTDPETFAAALRGIRDDGTLTSAKRDAIYKTLGPGGCASLLRLRHGQTARSRGALGD